MAKILTFPSREADSWTDDQTHWVYNGLDVLLTKEIWETLRKELDPVAQKTYEFIQAHH